MQIFQLLSKTQVATKLPGSDPESVLSKMVDLLHDLPSVDDLEEVKNAVFEREKLMSTGVGKGIALPHAKTSAVNSTVAALAVTDKPIEFRSLDGQPVRLIFLLVGPPESKSDHIRILSRMSRLLNRQSVRDELISASSESELLRILETQEKYLASVL